jgi:SAM-dependent methyltransferase
MYYVAEPARIFGVDPMRRSIEVCREDGVLGNLAQSDYLPSTLPVGDMRFDLIYSYSAFTHLSLRAACAALAVLRRSIKPDGLLVLTIRPVEFWSRYGLEPEVASRLQHDHAARGFAFRPHEMAPIDGDIPYGDTSMSIDWLIHQCPGWSYRGYDQGLDRLQTMILLSPA